MYIKNNTAKEFVLRFIDSKKLVNILDFACGTCSPWVDFLNKNTNITYYGVDYNRISISKAHLLLPERKDTIILQDGQKDFNLGGLKFDLVNTFSSLEHVVNKDLFIKNMISYMNDSGYLILNYDSGHFKTGKIKDILLNSLSVFLSKIRIEKYFTSYVKEAEILSILQKYGITVLEKKYFNISELKGIHKQINNDILLEQWYNYELSLNQEKDKDYLEKIFTSTVIIGKKGT